MLRPPSGRCSAFATLVATISLLACAAPSATNPASAPPRAEFLLSSAESTYWVTTTTGKVRARGVPLVLARYDGRFYELFAADDDLSYEDALLVAERLYRRDLLTGDSAIVFRDTVVENIADAYARAHPDERPLAPNDEGGSDPTTSATAQVDILDVFGPYVSYEYHVDLELPGRHPWHSTRRGVIDLRSGQPAQVSDLFGNVAGHQIESAGRRAYESARDSIIRQRARLTGDRRRAIDFLKRLRFDERSFTLSDLDGGPAVSFAIPGAGEGSTADAVGLEPLPAVATPWWKAVAPGLANADAEGNDRWYGFGYRILARYDTTGEVANVSIADSSDREWPLLTATAPLQRVEWLDHPALGDSDRRALVRAFNDAATYGEATRIAARTSASVFSLATRSRTSHASIQARQRKPARNVRAHDAGALQHSRTCVRRRDLVDNGQVRCDRGVSAQPRDGRHRVDRPRRFSRADSPRRSGGHEGERQSGRSNVDGGRCSRRSGRPAQRPATTHKLVLSDLRCG